MHVGRPFHLFAFSQSQGRAQDCLGSELFCQGSPRFILRIPLAGMFPGVWSVSAAELTGPQLRQWLAAPSSEMLTCDLLFPPAVRVAVWPNATVQEGQQVNLSCLAWSTHQDSLSYTWYKGGQQLLGVRSISLPSVTVSDATSYRCGVGLPGHTPHLSKPVTLDVLCESGWVWAVGKRDRNS